MSHEIRTPMHAILGMIHLAREESNGERQREYLGTAQQSADVLLGLLNDILDFSKIEAGQLQLDHKPFRLHRLLATLDATLAPTAGKKGLKLTIAAAPALPPVMIGDDLRIQQILLNLVGNAIKFTTTGEVAVRVEQTTEIEVAGKISVHFSVTDTGIGFDPEKLEDIFNSFEQADSSYTREYGGTGLGLAICRQLTGLMGGKIWAESRGGEGSSFHFLLDLEPCTTNLLDDSAEGGGVPQAPSRHLRILVVDDNEVNRDIASIMLEKDHQITTVGNGLEALASLRSQTFDLILMDVQMPVMDGLATTRTIRALEQRQQVHADLPKDLVSDLSSRLRGGHLAIVAMTAHAMGSDKEVCLAAGMDSYLTKPFGPEQLQALGKGLLAANPDRGLPRKKKVEETTAVSHIVDGATTATLAEAIIGYLQTTSRLTAAQIEGVFPVICKSVKDNLGKTITALDEEDYEGLRLAAHTLKGTLLQCGLHALAEQAEEMCRLSKNRSRPPLADLLEHLRGGLADLVAATGP
jgi:CheY-like chemotaxis protein